MVEEPAGVWALCQDDNTLAGVADKTTHTHRLGQTIHMGTESYALNLTLNHGPVSATRQQRTY